MRGTKKKSNRKEAKKKKGSMNKGTRRLGPPPLQLKIRIAYSSSSAGLIYAKTCVVGKGGCFFFFCLSF